MLTSDSNTSQIIDDLRDHKDDFTWLSVHVDTIYDEIRHGLEFPHTAQTAIEMLILAMPYVTTQTDPQRWEKLLTEALRHAMILVDNEALIQLWTGVGEIHLHNARLPSASTAFDIAFRRATSSTETEAMLLARIGMLRTSIIYSKHDVDKFIEDSLRLAQTINDPNLIAQLNYTLAVAYAHRAETQKALGHAQLALGYWYKNRTMKNRVLLIMAEACRSINLFDRAAWYLRHVETIYDRSYEDALQAYARGALLVELKQPQEALQWLDVAQSQFAALNRRYMTGATYQTIALAQIQLEQFDSAHQNIRRALITWEQIENQYQKAEAVYTLGYLYHAKKDLDQARYMYDFALGIAKNMSSSPMVNGLIARLQDDLDQLNPASQ